MKNSKVDTIVEGFWQYLKKRKDLGLLPEIIKELSKKQDQTKSSATVYSSEALLRENEEKIIEIIYDNFGIGVVHFEVDPSLMGGIKVKIGDAVLDLSLQNKLDRLVESI